MDQARRDWIDEVADAVRRVYAIGSPVGDMQDVVKNMGGKVDVDLSIPDGRIVKDSDNSFTVFVSAKADYFNSNRMRFTIAHELGHLFLHMYYRTISLMQRNGIISRMDKALIGEDILVRNLMLMNLRGRF